MQDFNISFFLKSLWAISIQYRINVPFYTQLINRQSLSRATTCNTIQMIHIKQTHHKLTNEQTALKMENPNRHKYKYISAVAFKSVIWEWLKSSTYVCKEEHVLFYSLIGLWLQNNLSNISVISWWRERITWHPWWTMVQRIYKFHF